MTRPVYEPTTQRSLAKGGYDTQQLQRRVIPGEWHYVGGVDEPPFENSWVNAGGGLRQLRFRESGLGGIDVAGVVTGGTPPSVVCTIPVGFSLPTESELIPGTGQHDWQLDPDGSLWVIT